ncbi:MAG: heavy metal translocating P-type ATPase [Phycisphaerales bacterium JB059]
MTQAATHTHGHDHDHAHEDGTFECCSHHEMEIDRYIILYLVGGVLAMVSWIASKMGVTDQIAILPAVVGSILLSLQLFLAALKEIRRGRISSSSLAALAILAAMAIGQFITAAFLAFVLLVADQIVRRTAFGAQQAIEALVGLTPDVARLVREDGREAEVSLSEIKVGQVVRVRAGENLPVDGKVISGRSTINQASLTGEALPVEVDTDADVYAGTTNLTGAIDVRVTQVGEDTTIGKVSTLIREAENSKTPRQMLIEQVARFYVPVALSLAALVFFLFSQSAEESTRNMAALTAVTVLVVTCPTALLLSSPTAMVAAFAAAARLGVMIKRTSYLESAANIDTVVLDKTGTITTGRFEVSRLAPVDGVEGADLLKAAAAAEAHSNHPLAQSIVTTARAARVSIVEASSSEEIHGRGVRAGTPMGELHVGRAGWIREIAPASGAQIQGVEERIEGMSGVHVLLDGKYLGAVGLEDKVRASSKSVIDRLRTLGVRSVSILTGDRLSVAKRVGVAVGADEIEAECLPEEKHELVRHMGQAGQKVMMVGDGINDGPALAEAEVGIAMGLSGSDIAANSAGVALMTDELNRLPFLIELARRTRGIVVQNIAVSILMAIIGLTLAATGTFAELGGIGVGFAALFHFAPDIFVVGNSFRLFRFGEDFHQAEAAAKEAANAPRRQMREGSVRRLTPAQV